MRHARSAVLLCVCAAIFWVARRADGAGFVDERLWLAERSSWSETVPFGQDPRGWWAVGNSRVFGVVGPGLSNAMIHQITGPHIMLAGVMNNGSAFGPATLTLTASGRPVPFATQTLSRVRGTDIVVMESSTPEITMLVFNYAPFGVNALLRTVVVRNTGKAPLSDIVLQAGLNRTIVKDGELYDSFKGGTGGNAMGQTRQLFSGFLEQADVSSNEQKAGTLTVKIGTLGPDEEAVRTQYLVFSMQEIGDEKATLDLLRRQGTNLLKKTYEDWRGWLATTTRLGCPDQRLVDLIDDTKILVKVQTAEPQAAAGPMEFFAGVWVRDSNGPFIYYLRMGDLETARKMLEFYYRASAYNNHIGNWMPMDIDVNRPVDPNMDWTKATNDRVEIPSWLIMQHYRYYQYTGDLEPIRQHWGYLKKCLYGQLTNDKGEPVHTENYGSVEAGPNSLYRFPHHGDETWIYPGFEVLNSAVFPEPNDHPHWDAFSADSTWEFVVSAEILGRLARALGRETEAAELEGIARESRAACERDYWIGDRGLYGPAMHMHSLDVHQPPFAMVNFNPLWIGYFRPDDPKAVSNVLETMKYTMNPNYVTDVTETLRIYVGMQPGMFLYNLSAIDHPFAEPALKAMMEVASPTGEYTEKHLTEPTSYSSAFLGHRIRPWEGGINMDAAFYYLTGLAPDMADGRITLCPRLVSGWKEMSVTGQRLGDGRLDVQVSDDGTKRTYTVKWRGSKAIDTDFQISLPQAKVTSVKVGDAPKAVTPRNRWGRTTASIRVELLPGQPTVVTVEYAKEAAEPVKFARERYRYVVPKDVPACQMVYWESEPRKANAGDMRAFDLLRGKVNFRLIAASNPCSPEWLRPFLLKSDGTLNTPLFLMGTNSVGNSLKYAKWWGDPELTNLLRQYMEAGGAVVALKTGERTSQWFGTLLGDSAYFIVPTQAAPVVPTEGAGMKALDVLGLIGGEKKLQSTGTYAYQNCIVLARTETEKAAGNILARKIGKGFFMTMLVDLDYAQVATIAQSLATPEKLAQINGILGSSKPESVAGAFEDFSKDNSFSDDFGAYQAGSIGLPVWLPLHGTWKMEAGEYHQLVTEGYDYVSTANARIRGDYEVEVRLKVVENILEGGFVFNLPSRFEKGSSQMVRFCGHEDLWCGPFSSGGGFTLEQSIKSGLTVRDKEWHSLKVTVRNSKGTYDLAVDGKKVAEGLKLTNVAPEAGAYIGLVACRGHVAYDDLKITPLRSQ